eukprot:scaffold143058_cov30-Tisochrysis_lutea.AAC.2
MSPPPPSVPPPTEHFIARRRLQLAPPPPPSTVATPSFFCSGGTIASAAVRALLLGLPLYVLLLPLTWLAALLAFPAVFLTLYMNSFMPLHDWAEKVPVLFIKFFNAERSLWPTPRFYDIAPDDDDDDSEPRCCAKAVGELYELQPKRELKKCPTAWGIGVYVPALTEAEYVNLRSLRLGLSGFWRNMGAAITDKLLGLMGWMPNTHLLEGGYLKKHGSKNRFSPTEDPVEYAMKTIGDSYPKFPDVWEDKLSDEALVRFCLHGLGPHRLERLPNGEGFVVRTNALAPLEVRGGYGAYGGDCYIGPDFRPVKIVRMERFAGASTWAPLVERVFTPGAKGWEYAKFCFRSTLFTLVTVCDHLYGVHLQWSNVMVVAARECLSPEHPVRRLLTPYYFGTIQVNYIANHLLIPPGTLGSRNFAFTDPALQQAWRAMPTLLRDGAELKGAVSDAEFLDTIFDCGHYFAWRTADLGVELPYYTQALKYWDVTRQLVDSFLKLWFNDAAEAAADGELEDFLLQVVGSLDATMHLTQVVRAMDAHKKFEFAINVITR